MKIKNIVEYIKDIMLSAHNSDLTKKNVQEVETLYQNMVHTIKSHSIQKRNDSWSLNTFSLTLHPEKSLKQWLSKVEPSSCTPCTLHLNEEVYGDNTAIETINKRPEKALTTIKKVKTKLLLKEHANDKIKELVNSAVERLWDEMQKIKQTIDKEIDRLFAKFKNTFQ